MTPAAGKRGPKRYTMTASASARAAPRGATRPGDVIALAPNVLAVRHWDRLLPLLDRTLARRPLDEGLGGVWPRSLCKTCWRTTATTATVPEAVRENEEVIPVNVSTWVLPSGVTVGR